jgi:hypothetical protein
MSQSLQEPSAFASAVSALERAGGRKRPRDPETGRRRPRKCDLYIAGHTVHWIQAIRSHDVANRRGHLVAVEGNAITADFDGEYERYRNHDPQRLLEIIGIGGTVIVCSRYSLLKSGGGYCFSIVDAEDPWRPCDCKPLTSATPEALAERLETHGGFVVPGHLVLDQLDG